MQKFQLVLEIFSTVTLNFRTSRAKNSAQIPPIPDFIHEYSNHLRGNPIFGHHKLQQQLLDGSFHC
jgi:hypothetical protein